MKKLLYLLFIISIGSPVAAQLTAQQQQKLENFLSVPTAGLDDALRKFTNEDLLATWNHYQNTKSIAEKRQLKLIEEYYMRKADEAAQNRLFYLFLAFIAYMTLIMAFVFLIFRKQSHLSPKS